MFSLTVTYSSEENRHFDMNYYREKHLPLVQEKYQPFGLQHIVVREGAAGKPGGVAQQIVSVNLVFDSAESMKKATSTAGKAVMDDIPNFTDAAASFLFSKTEIL